MSTDFVKLKVSSEGFRWTSNTVRAVVVKDMFVPIIFGLHWLRENKIVVDFEFNWCIHKPSGIDIRDMNELTDVE